MTKLNLDLLVKRSRIEQILSGQVSQRVLVGGETSGVSLHGRDQISVGNGGIHSSGVDVGSSIKLDDRVVGSVNNLDLVVDNSGLARVNRGNGAASILSRRPSGLRKTSE